MKTTPVSPSHDQEAAPAPARPRRGLGTRLSLGHVITLVAGLLAMLLVFSVLRGREVSYRVAVAGTDIRSGATVRRGAFRFTRVNVPDDIRAHLISPGADVDRLSGWIATRSIRAGELVTKGDFRPPAAPAQLRAMSVPVDPAHAVGGALSAGDRVDVIQVLDQGRAVWVASGIEVLSVNREDASRLARSRSFSITVAVSASTALRLAAAIRSEKFEVVRSTGAQSIPVQPVTPQPQETVPTGTTQPSTETTAG